MLTTEFRSRDGSLCAHIATKKPLRGIILWLPTGGLEAAIGSVVAPHSWQRSKHHQAKDARPVTERTRMIFERLRLSPRLRRAAAVAHSVARQSAGAKIALAFYKAPQQATIEVYEGHGAYGPDQAG